MKLEICVTTVQCALNAYRGGADQLELCSAWELGGLTPSKALVEEVLDKVDIPVKVLIRPRPGYFQYTDIEKRIMLRDILYYKDIGISGIVIGVLCQNNMLDFDFLSQVYKIVKSDISVTIHRAFDFCVKDQKLFDRLSDIGISTVMTAGGKERTVIENMDNMKDLLYNQKVFNIIAAGGINAENVIDLISNCPSLFAIHSPANKLCVGNNHFDSIYSVDTMIVKKLKDCCLMSSYEY